MLHNNLALRPHLVLILYLVRLLLPAAAVVLELVLHQIQLAQMAVLGVAVLGGLEVNPAALETLHRYPHLRVVMEVQE